MLQNWILPFAILIATFIGVALSRKLLRNLAKSIDSRILEQVIPSLSSVFYLIGLKLFADSAPIPQKIEIWIAHFIFILGILFVLGVTRKIALLGVEWIVLHTPNSVTLTQGFIPLIRNILTLLIFMVGGIMILKHFNYDVLSLLAALGVGSLAIGLAAKDTLSHMISGFTLIIDRNLKPGDQIVLADQSGEVEHIGLRSTRIRTATGNTLIVPNSELVNTKILNLSLPSRSIGCSIAIRVGFDVAFAQIRALCQEILTESRGVSHERGNTVLLTRLAEQGQLINLHFWIDDLSQEGQIVSDLNEKILARFKTESIPLLIIPTLFGPLR